MSAGMLLTPGYYLSIDNDVIRVGTVADGSRSYALRLIVRDGRIEWVKAFGLGRDLLISPITYREASRRVQAAIAA